MTASTYEPVALSLSDYTNLIRCAHNRSRAVIVHDADRWAREVTSMRVWSDRLSDVLNFTR